ncbi:MAG: NADH-quinone oxidoreductase subunit C [Candidatus Zixiibacteriota bacterium]
MNREELQNYIAGHFEGKLTLLDSGRHNLMFEVRAVDLLDVAKVLRDDENLKFDFLCCITGVDTGDKFEMVYSLASIIKNHRLDFKIILSRDNPEIETVTGIWACANWFEREIWELYGFNIKNHNNLTRFLLADDWNQGYPMRKDWDAPDFVRFPELEK